MPRFRSGQTLSIGALLLPGPAPFQAEGASRPALALIALAAQRNGKLQSCTRPSLAFSRFIPGLFQAMFSMK